MTVDDGQDEAGSPDSATPVDGSAGTGTDGGAGAAALPLAGLRLLVVDDSRTVRRSAADYLEEAGAEVTLADDGFGALATLVEVRPHALVADIVMPRLDGYQVCALVRANEDFAHVPVILLSSRDGLFDRARGSVAGASSHLSKPIEREALIATVAGLVGRADPPDTSAADDSADHSADDPEGGSDKAHGL